MPMPQTRVVDNAAAHRYEILLDEQLAGFIQYGLSGDRITMFHTEVAEEHENEGVGSILVREALDDTRAKGRTLRPLCPFVAAFVRRHPEYGDLIAS